MDSRKEAILEAIVSEYTQTGIPVGSLGIAKKYQFPFSSATIRAEMAELERLGFLTHLHTSAGRVPTEKGYRYFVNMMEDEIQLAEREELAARKRIEAMNNHFDRQLETAASVLSELTKNMGFAGHGTDFFSHGLGNLFAQPDFSESEQIIKTAQLLDNFSCLFTELPSDSSTRIYIGSEAPIGKSAGISIVLSEFVSPLGSSGYLGVLGPMRMSYGRNLAAVNEVKGILENA